MDANEIAELRIAGQVSADGLLAEMNLTEDGRCRRSRWLMDFSAGQLDLSHDDIQGLVVHFGRRPQCSRQDVKVAVIADGELSFGVARVLGAYVDELGIEVRPFYRRQEAISFLEENVLSN